MIAIDLQHYSNTLTDLGIEHKIIAHPELKTPPEVCAFLGLTLAEGLSTMIMKTGGGYIALIRRDDCRIDFKKLKQLIGKDIRMATPDEFTTLIGLPLGAARVYNPNLATYLDQRIFEKEYLVGGSGSFTCSIRYKTGDLPKIPGSQIIAATQA